jgi:dimethylargininase
LLTAVTHKPSPHLEDCELTYLPSRAIDFEKAIRQHRSYGDMLRRCGVAVIVLDANPHLPDSVFVEDTALVLDQIAIMTSMGAASRRAESEAIEAVLRAYRPIARIAPPARLEGGDVLRIGRKFYVGLSTRTNRAGLSALEAHVAPFGYSVTAVRVTGCLHLKTGCTALDDHCVLINPEWVDPSPFESLDRIEVPSAEPFAANTLRIDSTLCIHSGFTATWRMLERRGYRVETTDVSEFLKAEAGLTCMSLVFNHA